MHNIVLTGFMGTGKTTVGRLVAERLGFRFVDTDQLIVAEADMPIPQLFAEQGEAAFRRLEARICQHIAWERQTVIATGGGALLNTQTRDAFIAGGMVVCLHAPLEVIRQRVGEDPNRPLMADAARLYANRQAAYAALPHHVQTGGRTPTEITEEVITLWQK